MISFRDEGINAALKIAYDLAAARGEPVTIDILDDDPLVLAPRWFIRSMTEPVHEGANPYVTFQPDGSCRHYPKETTT